MANSKIFLCFMVTSIIATSCNNTSDHKTIDYHRQQIPSTLKKTDNIIDLDLIHCNIPTYNFFNISNSIPFRTLKEKEYISLKRAISFSKLPEHSKYETYLLSKKYAIYNYYIYILIYKDESCCTSAYYITQDSKSKKYISCKLIALNGSDANWNERDSLICIEHNSIKVVKTIRNGIENQDNGEIESYTTDFLKYVFNFNKNGEIVKHLVDSTRTSN